MKIGVLNIQGSVVEHARSLERLGTEVVLVKTVVDLALVGGLIIPGGESTTIWKLLIGFGLADEIIRRARAGMPIWGTCAGAILLAKKIEGRKRADTLKLMNIAIERNAYGRQLDSFEGEVEFRGGRDGARGGRARKIPAIFIRAPKIKSLRKGVEVLARHGDDIVAAREKNLFVTMLHPELTEDLTLHRYFLDLCGRYLSSGNKRK